jgi:hypothetical protein
MDGAKVCKNGALAPGSLLSVGKGTENLPTAVLNVSQSIGVVILL